MGLLNWMRSTPTSTRREREALGGGAQNARRIVMKRLVAIALSLALVFGVVTAVAPASRVAAVEKTPLVPVRVSGATVSANDEFVLTLIGDWPPEATRAAEIAAQSLASQLKVKVPVTVAMTWEPLDDFLGLGGSRVSLINFPGAVSYTHLTLPTILRV